MNEIRTTPPDHEVTADRCSATGPRSDPARDPGHGADPSLPVVPEPFGSATAHTPTSAPEPLAIDPAVEIERFTAALFTPGQIVEIRALGVREADDDTRRTVREPFILPDDLPDLTRKALAASGRAVGVDLTINPVAPAAAEMLAGGGFVKDEHILHRAWVLIDVDPVRSGRIGATDSEKAAAWAVARDVHTFLPARGWPAPVVTDSGNGYHLLVPVDLPADDGGRVKRLLRTLAARFDTARVKIDTAVFNPSRQVKLSGTLAAKAEATPDRPHRTARVIELPEVPARVTAARLDTLLADTEPSPTTTTSPASVRPTAASGPAVANPDAVRRARAYMATFPRRSRASMGTTAPPGREARVERLRAHRG